jgi:hypothetical protein
MAVNLSPIGNGAQFFDSYGRPLSGGLLNTYAAGTSTPTLTYNSSTGGTPNANPIVMGPDGRPPNEIWLTAGTAYKFVLTDSLSNVLGTYDNLTGIGDVTNLTTTGNTVLGTTGNTLNVGNGGFLVSGAGNITSGGSATITTTLNVNGNTTLGTGAGQQVTVNAGTVSLVNTPTISGAPTFSGAVTFSADPAGHLVSGLYVPTFTYTTNVTAASIVAGCRYMRVGPNVSVTGVLSITPTAAGACELRLTIPIASNFAGYGGGAGSGLTSSQVHGSGYMADDSANKMSLYFTAASGSPGTFGFSCMYVIY